MNIIIKGDTFGLKEGQVVTMEQLYRMVEVQMAKESIAFALGQKGVRVSPKKLNEMAIEAFENYFHSDRNLTEYWEQIDRVIEKYTEAR